MITTDKNIWIFDLDGTLADCTHRLHHIQSEPKNWPAFYDACLGDKPIEATCAINEALKLYEYSGGQIIILTGRSDAVRDKTIGWLEDNFIFFNELIMRRANDWRPDHVIKKEWLDGYAGKDQIAGVFEDRDQVVKMWRSSGIQCFQVASGDF